MREGLHRLFAAAQQLLPPTQIEVECGSIAEVAEAIECGTMSCYWNKLADRLMREGVDSYANGNSGVCSLRPRVHWYQSDRLVAVARLVF